MSDKTVCAVCDKELSLSWTDTHGVAQCRACGVPYRVYHYEGSRRVEKPIELMVLEEWRPLIKRYHAETSHRVPSGCSFPGGQEVATRTDMEAWKRWLDAHKEELPK